MTEYVVPPSIVANATEWTLVDFSGVSQSPLTGDVRTISRGQRWQAHLMWQNLIDDKRAAMGSLIARLRGKANRAWLTDPSYRQRGSFPTSELLLNPTFSGPSGFGSYGAATLYPGNRELQVLTTASGGQGFFQAVTLQAAKAYVLRGALLDGVGTAGLAMRVQWSNAGTDNLLSSTTLRGMFRAAAVCNANASWTVYPFILTAGAAGQVGFCQFASLARCALVVNPSALTCFTSCKIDALPASTAGLLLADDRVEINGEFKTVTADLNSDDTGTGQLMFEPAMRTPIIPDNSPVVIYQPMMRGVLASDAVRPSRPGLFSDYDLTFIED